MRKKLPCPVQISTKTRTFTAYFYNSVYYYYFQEILAAYFGVK